MRRKYVYRDGQVVDKATGKPDPRGGNLPPQSPRLCLANAYSDNPVISPVDHSVISTRQGLKEHNLRNEVVDIGNDPSGLQARTQKSDVDITREIEKDVVESYQKIEQNHPESIAAIKNIPDSKDLNFGPTRQYT